MLHLVVGRAKAGGYIIEWYSGDHEPFHVHIYEGSYFVGRYDVVHQQPMGDWKMTNRIRMGLPARKIHPDAEKHLEEVTLSIDGKRLIFLFESGEGYSIPRRDLPGDDGAPVTAIQIFDHRGAVSITQGSGEIYDLPWDSIKHYARGGRQRKKLLGPKLKKLRRERGLSQESLARAAGISRVQLTRLENNTSAPGLDTLMRLSRVLGISPQEFL